MTSVESSLTGLHQWFLENSATLSFAESCTGGLLSSLVVAQSGVSAYFLGSVVSYSAELKKTVLHVPAKEIEAHGEVSEEVALAMAQGVRQVSGSDWSVAVTGVAGPSGGTSDKPVGTVCFAVCGPNFAKALRKQISGEEREEVQYNSVQFALQFLQEAVYVNNNRRGTTQQGG